MGFSPALRGHGRGEVRRSGTSRSSRGVVIATDFGRDCMTVPEDSNPGGLMNKPDVGPIQGVVGDVEFAGEGAGGDGLFLFGGL